MFGIEEISAACGYITSSNLNGVRTGGTGYLIAPARMATCAHVIDRAVPETIQVEFDGAVLPAKILCIDADNDCAVLDLPQPPGPAPLRLGSGCAWKAAWDGFGYPGLGNGTGVTTSGIVSNPKARDDQKAQVLELTSPEAAAGMASPLHGFSGSPVVVNGVVVGHIKRFLSDPDHPLRPAYGKVYAAHAHCVLAMLEGQAPDHADEMAAPRRGTADNKAQVDKVLGLLARWAGKDMPYEEARLSAADSLIQLGEPLIALQVLDSPRRGLRDSQLRALALAKTREPAQIAEAVQILEALWRDNKDGETGGLLAGRYKQLWDASSDEADLRKCHQTYLEAFEHSKDFYPGINAAATALWLNENALSQRLARQVLDALAALPITRHDAWYHATEGEAQLLLGDVAAAKTCYQRAVHQCEHAPETVLTMRAQAEKSLVSLGRDRAEFALVFARA